MLVQWRTAAYIVKHICHLALTKHGTYPEYVNIVPQLAFYCIKLCPYKINVQYKCGQQHPKIQKEICQLTGELINLI
jgi:hypothetical protein